MSSPLTASDIASGLLVLSRQLEKVSTDLDAADVALVDAKHAADIAESRAFLEAEGSMDMRRHIAKLETDELRFRAEMAEAAVRQGIRARDTIKVRIDVGRSANAALRAEIGALG